MPKNKVETKRIDKKIFLQIIKAKGSSIRKLGAVDQSTIKATEKTIRRQLNAGSMRPNYIEEIAKYLDIDSRVLTGELIYLHVYKNEYPLSHLDEYPYYREERDAYLRENIKETLSRILSLFNRSYSQFEAKEYEEQYQFQKELLEAIYPIVRKYFDIDGFGKKDEIEAQWVFAALDNSKDDYYEEQWANTTLRQSFLENPPDGYTKEKINKMSTSDLIGLSMNLQRTEKDDAIEKEFEERMKKKYHICE
jgi:hypothetical protein